MRCFCVEKSSPNSNYISSFILFFLLMKKLVYILFLGIFLVLFWCGRDTGVNVNVDNKDVNEKIMVVQQMLINWEITQKQAQEITQNIWNYSVEDIVKTKKSLEMPKVIWLPNRAKNLWLTEPVWMILDQNISKITSINNDNEWFDSVILSYKWDYLKSMEEAAKISKLAGISVSNEFKQAKEIEKNSPEILNQMWDDVKNSIKWIVYSNNNLIDTNVEYLISISVDDGWILTINAANYKQMKDVIKTN